MKISITSNAIKWFKDEMGLVKGDHLKFYAQFYGSSPVQETYSLGFTKDDPIDIAVSTEMNGIKFFVEETDLWYFNEHDLQVDYDDKIDEIVFQYTKSS